MFFGPRAFDLHYEDLIVYQDDRCILETTSHEGEMRVIFTEEELEAFADFEDNRSDNLAIIDKLRSIYLSQDEQTGTNWNTIISALKN